MKNVLRKLQTARMMLGSREIKKSGHNKFANYYYMELSDFLVPVQTIFNDLGLCGVVSFGPDLATLTITDLDSGEQVLITSPMSSAALKGCHEVQNLGAVQTYTRRYLWVAALEIVEHDALDSTTGSAPKTPVKAALQGVEINEEDQAYLKELASEIVEAVDGLEGTPAKGYDLMTNAKLDGDQKLYLWSVLQPNSKVRAALKKESDARKASSVTSMVNQGVTA